MDAVKSARRVFEFLEYFARVQRAVSVAELAAHHAYPNSSVSALMRSMVTLGYLSYDAHAADLLFQLVSRRYETKALVVTTNLPFKQWDTIFPNASCAVALIDRLTHHAEIVAFEGDSYRLRDAERSQKARRPKKAE